MRVSTCTTTRYFLTLERFGEMLVSKQGLHHCSSCRSSLCAGPIPSKACKPESQARCAVSWFLAMYFSLSLLNDFCLFIPSIREIHCLCQAGFGLQYLFRIGGTAVIALTVNLIFKRLVWHYPSEVQIAAKRTLSETTLPPRYRLMATDCSLKTVFDYVSCKNRDTATAIHLWQKAVSAKGY